MGEGTHPSRVPANHPGPRSRSLTANRGGAVSASVALSILAVAHRNRFMWPCRVLLASIVSAVACFGRADGTAWGADTTWMLKAKYGIFMHYQYRILLGYSVATRPSFPEPAQMTAGEWNRLVDGFDVNGFAAQMAEAKVGWVIFCLDDHYFAWPCAPNQAFSDYTGYAPGEKCSRRDLILDLAGALNAKGSGSSVTSPV